MRPAASSFLLGHWLLFGLTVLLIVLIAASAALWPGTTPAGAQDGYQPDQELIDDVWTYARETDNGYDHVLRWVRVLKTLGAVSDMSASEAQGYADEHLAERWDPVVAELEDLEAAPGDYEPDQQVIDDVRSYARETQHGYDHVLRWMRVLKTLGAVADMPSSEAQENADRFDAERWDPVVAELERKETAASEPEPTQTPEPTPEPPPAPAGLIATGGDAVIDLSWTDPSDGALTKYQVRVSADGGASWDPDWTDIADSGAATTSHRLTGLTNDTAYTIELRALRGQAAGAAASAPATPRPEPPPAPAGLIATSGDTVIELSWTEPSDNAITKYQVRVSADGGSTWAPDWTDISGSGAAATSHTVTGLTNDTAYTIELRAVRGAVSAGPAASATATPSANSQDVYEPDQQVIDDVKDYARETERGYDHVLRWMRVLKTLGAVEDMSAAEAQENADRFDAERWGPVAVELEALENDPGDYQLDQQVIADVESYAAETASGFDHVLRWMRALHTFGVLEDMTAAEAQGYADRFPAARWDPVAAELEQLEAAQSQANRAPVVNTEAVNYAEFVGNSNAPRGIMGWKRMEGIFSDPDGDELTYAASVPADRSQLVESLDIHLEVIVTISGEKADFLFIMMDDDASWKSVTPALADPLITMVTLTATDPEGLSASVSGDFLTRWEIYPEVARAVAREQAIELTFDLAVEANPAPEPEQFTVHVVNGDGSSGTIAVSSVSVNGKVVTLELASALSEGQTVSLDYAYDSNDDTHTALQRAGGGDAAPGFTGQAVASLLEPPGEPQNFAVSAAPGNLDLSATWDALDGATSYWVSWRQSGGIFEAGNETMVAATSSTITMSGYGQWAVRLEACNDAGCGPSVWQKIDVELPTGLQVAVTANPAHPTPGAPTRLTATMTNPPSEENPAYDWQIHFVGNWVSIGNASWLTFIEDDEGETRTFRVTVSYDTGESAMSDPITITWTKKPPNRAPVVNEQAERYDSFVERQSAPRGSPVRKLVQGILSDPDLPDRDKLTYTVSVPDDRKDLVETLGAHEATHQVTLEMDGDDDWKAVSPALPDPLTITVTLTATDTYGLSASVSGEFFTDWESHPAPVSAAASPQAIALTFDLEVQANPAPGPGQFTVNVVNEDGSEETIAVSSVSVNDAVVTLELASELAQGQRVTLDYAHDDDRPLRRASGGGDSAPGFTGQVVRFSLAALSSAPVCDRTPQIRDAILNMIPGVADCAEVTDEQLAAITGNLRLKGRGIRMLRVGDFDGLSNLSVLDLQHNRLKSLPQGVFDDLARMNRLRLNNNQLTELSPDIFTRLTGMENLHLANNKLTTVPVNLLANNTNLVFMSLYNNGLTELPAGLFDGLANLEELHLNENGLTTLPAGLFADLTSISTLWLDDAVNPRLCERPQKEQDSIMGQLPEISDCRLVTNRDVALALAAMPSPPLCERTPQVREAILTMLPDLSDCADVTDVHLAAITGTLSLASQEISTLRVGDFDGLSGLNALDLQHNMLTSLPVGSFNDLIMARWVLLNNNQLAILEEDTFSGMDNLRSVSLTTNNLETIPSGLFTGRTELQEISLDNNRLAGIPAGAFKGLSALRTLHLHENKMKFPAAGENRRNPLPTGLFADLTAIETLTRDRSVDPHLCDQPEQARDAYLERIPDIDNCQLVTWGDISLAARQYIEEEYILPYQYDHPWLHEVWFDDPVRVLVGRYPGYYGWHWYNNVGFYFPYPFQARDLVYHELAHHYSFSVRATADNPTAKLSMLSFWLYLVDHRRQFGHPGDNVVESYPGVLQAWVIKGKDAGFRREETYAVAESVSSQEIPQWFFDTYTADGTLDTVDLAQLWADFRYARDTRAFTTENLRLQLKSLFGGYCSDREGQWALNNSSASNPWVDGGCLNWRPGQLTATAGGAGEITVSWNAPLRSSSPSINAYVVQWKSGDNDYDTSRQAIVTTLDNLSHTITGLTAGAEYTVRVAAVNQSDTTDFADDLGHSRTVETTANAG